MRQGGEGEEKNMERRTGRRGKVDEEERETSKRGEGSVGQRETGRVGCTKGVYKGGSTIEYEPLERVFKM